MSDELKGIFKDAESTEWKPIFTTPVLLKLCRECDVTLETLLSARVNFDCIFIALWLACEYQAKDRKVSKDLFFALIPPGLLPEAMKAFWISVRAAFPQLKEVQVTDEMKKKVGELFGLGKLGIW